MHAAVAALALVMLTLIVPASATSPFDPPETYACGARIITIDGLTSRYYWVEDPTFPETTFWLYEETGIEPGLQRGGSNPLPYPLSYSDACDVRHARPSSVPDLLLY